MKYTYKKLSEDTDKVEYEVKVDINEFNKVKDETYTELAQEVVIPGFRPGKGPKESIEAKLGTKLINETINRLFPRVAAEVVQKEKMRPVTQLAYDIKDLDANEISFSFSFTNFPKAKFGDFSKIKAKKTVESIKEDEIDTVIKSIIRSSLSPEVLSKYKKNESSKEEKSGAKSDKKKKKKAEATEEVHDHSHGHDHDHSDHDHSHTHTHPEQIDFELSDELILELGYEKEKTLNDVRESVKEKLTEIKAQQAEQDYVEAVVLEAKKLSKIEMPKVFIETEVKNMEDDFINRLSQLNLKPEEYLTTQGSSLEKKREEWRKIAEEKVSTDILLINLALEHDVMPEEKDVDKEISIIQEPKLRADYDTPRGRELIRTVLTRRMGLNKLMEQVEKK